MGYLRSPIVSSFPRFLRLICLPIFYASLAAFPISLRCILKYYSFTLVLRESSHFLPFPVCPAFSLEHACCCCSFFRLFYFQSPLSPWCYNGIHRGLIYHFHFSICSRHLVTTRSVVLPQRIITIMLSNSRTPGEKNWTFPECPNGPMGFPFLGEPPSWQLSFYRTSFQTQLLLTGDTTSS